MEKAFGGVSHARFQGADAPGVAERKQRGNWRKEWGEGSGVNRSVSRLAPFLEGRRRTPPGRRGKAVWKGEGETALTPALGGQCQGVAGQ